VYVYVKKLQLTLINVYGNKLQEDCVNTCLFVSRIAIFFYNFYGESYVLRHIR